MTLVGFGGLRRPSVFNTDTVWKLGQLLKSCQQLFFKPKISIYIKA